MSTDLSAAFAADFLGRFSSIPYGEGQLLTTPLHLAGGSSVTLYVEQFADDTYFISDRGQAADALADSGVDLGSKRNRNHWDAIKRSTEVDEPLLRDISVYEIAGFAVGDDLGRAMNRMAEAVVRGDALRVLGRVRPVTFRDKAMRRASEHNLTVVPSARVSTRFGESRELSFKASGKSDLWVQAISGADVGPGVDHARVVLGDATEPAERKISLIASSAKLAGWQLRALEEVG